MNFKIDVLAVLVFIQFSFCQAITNTTFSQNSSKFIEKIPFRIPLYKKDIIKISSFFGYRIHPLLKKKKMHKGIDFVAMKGTPVMASAHGKVEKASVNSAYGQYIIINHNNVFKTLYAHLSQINVQENQVVKACQLIGEVGSTGLSTGYHLHYETYYRDEVINPKILWKLKLIVDRQKK